MNPIALGLGYLLEDGVIDVAARVLELLAQAYG